MSRRGGLKRRRLEEQMDQMEEQENDLQREIDQMSAKINILTKNIRTLKASNQIKRLRRSPRLMNNENVQILSRENEKIQQQLSNVEAQLRTRSDQVAELESQVQQLKYEASLRQTVEESTIYLDTITNLEKKIDEIQKEMINLNNDRESLSNRNKGLRSQLEEMSGLIEASSDENSLISKKLQDCTNLLMENKTQINNFKETLKTREESIDNLNQDLENQRQIIAQLNVTLEGLRQERRESSDNRENLQTLQEQLNVFEREINDKQAKIETLSTDINAQRSQCDREIQRLNDLITTNNNEYLNQIQALQLSINNKDLELELTNQELLNQQINFQQENNAIHTNLTAQLERERALNQNQLSQINNELDTLRRTNRELQENLENERLINIVGGGNENIPMQTQQFDVANLPMQTSAAHTLDEYSTATFQIRKSHLKLIRSYNLNPYTMSNDQFKNFLSKVASEKNLSSSYLSTIISSVKAINKNITVSAKSLGLKRKQKNIIRNHEFNTLTVRLITEAFEYVRSRTISNVEIQNDSLLAVILVFLTNLRMAEVLQITSTNLDEIYNQQPVNIHIKKNDRPIPVLALVPLYKSVYPDLKFYASLNSNKKLINISSSSINKYVRHWYMRNLQDASTISNIGLKAIRSFNTSQMVNRNEIELARVFNRHANASTTIENYNYIDPQEVLQEMNVFNN